VKVVWLCNYSLQYLEDLIDITVCASRFHPTTWIHYLITEISKRKEIDLHIITSAPYINRRYIKLAQNNVTYHIIKSGIPLVNKGFPNYFRLDVFSNYYLQKKVIIKLISTIEPDIITAHGTENVYSLPLIEINYPSVVWIQGLIYSLIEEDSSYWVKKQLILEKLVFHKQKYFISNTSVFDKIIKRNNNEAKISYLSYPISNEAFNLSTDNTESDISFAGSLIKRKGIEDVLATVKILKKDFPEIRAKIIGQAVSQDYLNYLKRLAKEFDIEKNLLFVGFCDEHIDVLKHVKSSKVFLFPSHMDTGPRAVAESMAMEIPVVAYNIDGLPWMLGKNERGLLVEKGDIKGLANSCKTLLQNSNLREKLGVAGREFAFDNFHTSKIVDNLLEIYKEILDKGK